MDKMMNNFNMSDTRSRRNLLNWTGFFPYQSITNYSSDPGKMKMEMKNTFGDNLFISNLHLIPDPLKKNLADSVMTGEVKTKTNMASETKTFVTEPKLKDHSSTDHRTDSYQSLSGITSFLSGVFSFVSGVVFHKRTDSTQYYECFEQNFDESVPSLQAWHFAKPEVQNKNGRAHNVINSTNKPHKPDSSTVDSNCGITTADCENKLQEVRLLLQSQHSQYQSKLDTECPANVFAEQSSIDDYFEDAFTSEDFGTLPDEEYLEYYSPFSHQNPQLLVSDAPKIKTEYMPLTENMEITSILPDAAKNDVSYFNTSNNEICDNNESKSQIVASCEEKMSKLKALLQEKHKNKTRSEQTSSDENIDTLKNNEQRQTKPISIPNHSANISKSVFENNKQEVNMANKNKFYNKFFDKNSPKDISKVLKCSLDDLDCSDSSPEYLDPCNYFDEVTGKFYSASVDSEDSFQIVFTDSPRSCRGRLPSECESEDSFIVFEDSPDSCYSSKDVFGDDLYANDIDEIESASDSDSTEECDDSDSESDSGCDAFNQTCKLSHSLTRTIGDLTDDSLYEIGEDEVDCAALFVQEKPISNVSDDRDLKEESTNNVNPKGLLVNDKRKLEKNKLPKKSVRFSEKPPKVHVMRVWAFAAKQARAGHWERHALDRERFKRRIADVEMVVSWVLRPQHRTRVMFQRFMPWWNAQKRKELADDEETEKAKKEKVREVLNEKQEAKLHSESDFKGDKIKIENNPDKYNIEEIKLNDHKCIQKNPNSTCTIEEMKEKHCEEAKTPNGIYKNGNNLMNAQVAIVDNDINVLKFGHHGDIDVST